MRYKELKYKGQIYTEPFQIDEILIENNFNWLLDCEIGNMRIEIFKNTLIINGGIFYNGIWKFGCFRAGEFRYGVWENGVFYNGLFKNGIFQNGIIFGGKFMKGEILKGEIRGGEFNSVKISDIVKRKNTSEKIVVPETNTTVNAENPTETTINTQSIQENFVKKFNEYF